MTDAGAILFLFFVGSLAILLFCVHTSMKSIRCQKCMEDPGGRNDGVKKKSNKENAAPWLDISSSSDEDLFLFGRDVEKGPARIPLSAYGDASYVNTTPTKEPMIGRFRFDIRYSVHTRRLEVKISDADSLLRPFPTFKISLVLLPGDQQFTTKSVASVKPTYNEVFVFQNVSPDELRTSTIRFRLIGSKEGVDQALGQIFYPLLGLVQMKKPEFMQIWRTFRKMKSHSHK